MENKAKADLEFFKDQCKKYNLKITPQRTAIYNVIFYSREHPNTEHVYKIVKKEFPNISFDTVYRTLLTFSNINLIEKVEGFLYQKRFDSNLDEHHHLYCEKCGKIFDFQNKEYNNLKVPAELTKNFQVSRKRVVISGLCRDCMGEDI